MIIKCDNLSKSFGERELFKGLSFSLEKKDTMAIIGRNGCGKSTLLKIIAKEIPMDSGNIQIGEDLRIAYLEQVVTADEEDKRSGGERTRAALEEAFGKKPHILILDEPTNHLDMDAIENLQKRLTSFAGTIILVSHDRYLISKCANKILDLNTRPCKLYKCGYEEYLEQKELIRLTNERSIKKTTDKIKHEKQVIEKLKSFNREKSIKRAESREKMLARIEIPETFEDVQTKMGIFFSSDIPSGKDVLTAEGLKKSFKDKEVLKNVNLNLRYGEHVGIIGKNGCGKTTLFNLILGNETANAGEIKLGTNVLTGYYDQKLAGVNEKLTLFEQIQTEHRTMNDTDVRNMLAAFSFYGDEVFKQVGSLSGGERGRLSLLLLMLSKSNLLLMDEPTNHLDMESAQILEDAVNSYTGTVLFISHDRYFLNRCAERIIEIEDGNSREYLGNYDEFLKKKNQLLEKGIISKITATVPEEKAVNENRLKWEDEKKQMADVKKRQRREANIMLRIEELEALIEELDIEMAKPENASNHIKLQELSEKKQAHEDEMNLLYEELEELV